MLRRAAIDVNCNASFGGEVERNVSRDNDFSASFIKRASSFSASFPHQGVTLASSSRYPDDRILGGNQHHV
jgi:hypothetical protein